MGTTADFPRPLSIASDIGEGAAPRAAGAPRLAPAVLETLMAQLPVGVLVTDATGRSLYANDAARSLLDDDTPTDDEISCRGSRTSDASVARSARARVGWPVARALLTGETVRDEEVAVIARDGRRRWLSIRATPVRTAERDVEGVVLTVADVTERKRLQDWAPAMETLARL
jgi:PAS domain-containing protein